MSTIKETLASTTHRPFAMPSGRWVYYQEWNHALFLHWEVSLETLQPLIPEGVTLDLFEGKAWVSLVGFTMNKIRPRHLPAVSLLSDFHEINLRTYVTHENKPGVYFLNIEAEKLLSVLVAKSMSGLPYEKAEMSRKGLSDGDVYRSHNPQKGFRLDVKYKIETVSYRKTPLDFWLTERYCLYVDSHKKIYRYDIHHEEWGIAPVSLVQLEVNYRKGNLELNAQPDRMHYSEGVKVLAWRRRKIGLL
ncbi:YqjF family protein [Taibaiella soli]|uniref:DUF2071 domain-containing protein n=1 Tax=Taibaiella soli TaxID=1649169 RepID=A0A2W2BFH3_9BACT|nr:DUF2071 domain-containing protein [Taibaiella soli]PZF74989.1 DUF2071 domain-containing protein [Taibaiella soli]